MLDYVTVDAMRTLHPAWRLLRSDHAALIASFLHRVFVAPNVRAMAAADLTEALEDELYGLREKLGAEAFPKPALDYLNEWAGTDKGWLRKFYRTGSDEPQFDLMPATEKAIAWLGTLVQRGFVGTESRLLTLFDLLKQMSEGSEADPARRIAELRKRRADIDAEIARVQQGDVPLLDDTALKDRFQQFVQLARDLLTDFREVEQNFRVLDRRVRERIAFDRHGIADRSRFVLGWTNAAKIAALEARSSHLQGRVNDVLRLIGEVQSEQRALKVRLDALIRLEEFTDFLELDWAAAVTEIAALTEELRLLAAASDVLNQLNRRLQEVQAQILHTESELETQKDKRSKTVQKTTDAEELKAQIRAVVDAAAGTGVPTDKLWTLCADALGEHQLTVESCDNREQEVRTWLQARIDADDHRLRRLRDKIIQAMMAFKEEFKLQTSEIDASIEAAFVSTMCRPGSPNCAPRNTAASTCAVSHTASSAATRYRRRRGSIVSRTRLR